MVEHLGFSEYGVSREIRHSDDLQLLVQVHRYRIPSCVVIVARRLQEWLCAAVRVDRFRYVRERHAEHSIDSLLFLDVDQY